MKRKIFYFLQILGGVLLILSLCLNYVFYKADIEFELAYKKILKIESTPSPIQNSIEAFHEELTRGSLEFLRNEKRLELPQYMSISFLERFKKSQVSEDLPIMGLIHGEVDAFLFLELLDDAIKANNQKRIDYLKNYFDDHTLDMAFVHREQAIKAIVSLRLFSYTKEEKYKSHANKMYKWLLEQDSDYGIIYYPGIKVNMVDVIGMAVPFLVEYSKEFNCPEAYKLAVKQIDIYTKHGCDQKTGLPAFGYSLDLPHVKIGRMNWGRGISWFVIGLSYIEFDDLLLETQATVINLNQTLTEIWKNEHRFGHFVYDYIYERDLTAELPIIYYLCKTECISLSNREILEYSKFMHDGIMYHCSNSNEGAIQYGIAHGPLTLGQAFMLKLTK